MQEIGKKYTRALFTISNNKFKTYWQYELRYLLSGTAEIYTSSIRLEKDRGYNKSKNMPYWLVIKNRDSWRDSSRITGLTQSQNPLVFYGDQREPIKGKPKSLLILEFSENYDQVIIDYYNDYYPYKPMERQKLLASRNYYLN